MSPRYLPAIYKMESLARNAFLSYEKVDAMKIWHFRWWLFAAVQRQVCDKFTIRKDGTVSIAAQNWMRIDPEQADTDQELSYEITFTLHTPLCKCHEVVECCDRGGFGDGVRRRWVWRVRGGGGVV